MIIGISGKINSGKSTVGDLIHKLSSKHWESKMYAGKLKQIAGLLTGVDPQMFENREFKQQPLPEYWQSSDKAKMTYRELLQRVGTDALRNNLHNKVWINALFADYKPADKGTFYIEWQTISAGYNHPSCAHCKKDYIGFERQYLCKTCIENDSVQTYPNWLVTDVRFPNEVTAIEGRGGIVLRIDRPGPAEVGSQHPSEVALDDYPFKSRITNNGTLEHLEYIVKHFLKINDLL